MSEVDTSREAVERLAANAKEHGGTAAFGVMLLALLARAEAAEAKWDTEEEAHYLTVGQLEECHETLDRMAAAIAPPEVLGEHSNVNDPWENAIEYADGRLLLEMGLARSALYAYRGVATRNNTGLPGQTGWAAIVEAIDAALDGATATREGPE